MPMNVYERGFPHRCINCVCYYCTRENCPFIKNRFYRWSKHYFCEESIERGACPRLDCDFFVNKRLRVNRKYVIIDREHREAPLTKAVNQLVKRFENLEKTLWEKNTDNQTK